MSKILLEEDMVSYLVDEGLVSYDEEEKYYTPDMLDTTPPTIQDLLDYLNNNLRDSKE